MKHILVFNDNSEDDRDQLKRMEHVTDLCLALWDIQEVMRKYFNKDYSLSAENIARNLIQYDGLYIPLNKKTAPKYMERALDELSEAIHRDICEIMDKYDVHRALDGL